MLNGKIPIYTFYSDSHSELFNNYFLPSFNEHLSESFVLYTMNIEQKCETGEFNTEGFSETMADKLVLIKRAIADNKDTPFVYADCDIQFFGDFRNDIDLSGVDIVCQEDRDSLCAGFFFARGTERFENYIDLIIENNNTVPNDQILFNEYSNSMNWRLLPRKKYYTVGNFISDVWDGDPIIVPKDVVVHHANYTIGLPNKIKLMNEVKKQLIK